MVRYFSNSGKKRICCCMHLTQQNGGTMTLVIGIITTIITLLIIALEVMIGYERGIRKNIIRAVMLILVAFLTLLITPAIVDLIVRNLILTNNLYDYLYRLTGVNPISYGFVQESAVNMFVVFLNPFVYVILFWILKLISFGIYLLIDRYIINRKLTKLFPCPTKKGSIAGAVLGGFYAILIGAIFFMPVSAYSELLQETEKTTTLVDGENGAVSEMFGNGNYRIAVSYQRTPSYYFYKYTGSKIVGDAVFASLSERETENATVSVEHYIPSIARVYRATRVLQGLDTASDTLTVTDYITSFNVIVAEIASQELITGTDKEKLSLMQDIVKQSVTIQENRILQAIAKDMRYETITALQQDMKILEEFSTLLVEKEMISDLMMGSSELSSEEVIERLDDEFVLRIADVLYSMDQADIVVPMIMDKLLELLLGDEIISTEELEHVENFGDTKQDFTEVCKSARQLAYLLNYEVSDEEASRLLEDSLATLDSSRLIPEDTLRGIEQILQNKLMIDKEQN